MFCCLLELGNDPWFKNLGMQTLKRNISIALSEQHIIWIKI
ncbi:hypothetical protein T06_3711 [Trichinella sp. T6]|nr:hypothetical protein T06_3711 [Trichinella sp. T6]